MVLQCFTGDTIESDILHLLGAHGMMLRVCDEYFRVCI